MLCNRKLGRLSNRLIRPCYKDVHACKQVWVCAVLSLSVHWVSSGAGVLWFVQFLLRGNVLREVWNAAYIVLVHPHSTQHGGPWHGAECAVGGGQCLCTQKPLAPGSRVPQVGCSALYNRAGLHLSRSLASQCTDLVSFSVPWFWRACPIWNMLPSLCQQLHWSGQPLVPVAPVIAFRLATNQISH